MENGNHKEIHSDDEERESEPLINKSYILPLLQYSEVTN